MVRAVKNHKAGFVVSDSNLKCDSTIADVVKLTEATGHSTIPITEDSSPSGELFGLITDKDYRLSRVDLNTKVSELMTPFSKLIVGQKGITIEDANDLIWEHKINCLPIVDENRRLVHLVFRKDYDDHKKNPLESIDFQKRLVVVLASIQEIIKKGCQHSSQRGSILFVLILLKDIQNGNQTP